MSLSGLLHPLHQSWLQLRSYQQYVRLPVAGTDLSSLFSIKMAAALIVLVIVVLLFKFLVWTPLRFLKHFTSQGVPSQPYRFLVGEIPGKQLASCNLLLLCNHLTTAMLGASLRGLAGSKIG